MRTVTVYNFKELEPAAKLRAIEEVREALQEEEYYEAALWAGDDCALFEPVHDEMTELLGNDYYEKNGNQFVFKNNRINIGFDDYEIHIKEALEITNDKMFKKWLGIPDVLSGWIEYEFISFGGKTDIEFECTLLNSDPRYPAAAAAIEKASEKFSAHVLQILNRLENGVGEYFSDDNVEDRILEGEYEFDESGSTY
jgi:hypothetical protein